MIGKIYIFIDIDKKIGDSESFMSMATFITLIEKNKNYEECIIIRNHTYYTISPSRKRKAT